MISQSFIKIIFLKKKTIFKNSIFVFFFEIFLKKNYSKITSLSYLYFYRLFFDESYSLIIFFRNKDMNYFDRIHRKKV
jgi:hypothetical protein